MLNSSWPEARTGNALVIMSDSKDSDELRLRIRQLERSVAALTKERDDLAKDVEQLCLSRCALGLHLPGCVLYTNTIASCHLLGKLQARTGDFWL
jgi:hypothetical protein